MEEEQIIKFRLSSYRRELILYDNLPWMIFVGEVNLTDLG